MTPVSGTPPRQPALQPLLNDAVIAFRAPTQVWSARTGDAGAAAIEGVYHGDVRHVRALELTCEGSVVEWISAAPAGPDRVVFGGLLRGLDDASPDPKVRLLRDRVVSAGRVRETLTVASKLGEPIVASLTLRVEPDFAWLHEVKSGIVAPRDSRTRLTVSTAPPRAADASRGDSGPVAPAAAEASVGDQSFVLRCPGATPAVDGGAIVATWDVRVEPGGSTDVSWELELHDAAVVVQAAGAPAPWDAGALAAEAAREPRLARWLEAALGDLDALRLALPEHPADEFLAAGAPWFFTLFGRDSLWAARLALPTGTGLAASTLRVLARLQGSTDDPEAAEEPGKILHELRATTFELPGEGISLPPLYYGSVDSTPLWVCLLGDAWRAGMPEAEVRPLLPALVRALRWILDHGDSDGDGFLDYIDRTGRGLANQGWKDSGDSIQWRDGTLAEGPIALCEVQAYAYEAVLAGADLLETFERYVEDQPGVAVPTPAELREWAATLRARFAAAFWVETPEGRYPAVALDRDKRPVDTLTSNIGHLLGTGLLDPEDEAGIVALLVGPAMSSGFGIRTMSTDAAGYWPLSYHGGSVWTHDTAICAWGMARAGLLEPAREVVAGLLAAAEGFGYRVPELHSGDAAGPARPEAPHDAPAARGEAVTTVTSLPTPYPAACRPQAWSAAAAITCHEILRAG